MAGEQRWGSRPPQTQRGGSECLLPQPPFSPYFRIFGEAGPAGRARGPSPAPPPALKGRFVRGGAVGEGPAALPPQPCPGGMKDFSPTDNGGGRGPLPPHGPARSGGPAAAPRQPPARSGRERGGSLETAAGAPGAGLSGGPGNSRLFTRC